MNIYSISKLQEFKDKSNNEKKIFFKTHPFAKFKNITLEDVDNILIEADTWLNKNANLPIQIKLFNLYYFLNNNHFKSNDHAFLFLIFIIDKNLDLINIFYEESTMDRIKERFEETTGYTFDKRFLIIEKAYNNKFNIVEDIFASKKY